MKKFLLYGGLTVAILAIGVYFTLQYFLGSIVKAASTSSAADHADQGRARRRPHLAPFGDGTLSGLSVGNPAGWSNANAFHLGKVHVNLETVLPFSRTTS